MRAPELRRQRIIVALQEHGPLGSRELEAVLDMPWDNVHANLEVLRKQGAISRADKKSSWRLQDAQTMSHTDTSVGGEDEGAAGEIFAGFPFSGD